MKRVLHLFSLKAAILLGMLFSGSPAAYAGNIEGDCWLALLDKNVAGSEVAAFIRQYAAAGNQAALEKSTTLTSRDKHTTLFIDKEHKVQKLRLYASAIRGGSFFPAGLADTLTQKEVAEKLGKPLEQGNNYLEYTYKGARLHIRFSASGIHFIELGRAGTQVTVSGGTNNCFNAPAEPATGQRMLKGIIYMPGLITA